MKIAIFALLFVSCFGNFLYNKYINDRYVPTLRKEVHTNTLEMPLYKTFERVMRWLKNENRENQWKQIRISKFILYNSTEYLKIRQKWKVWLNHNDCTMEFLPEIFHFHKPAISIFGNKLIIGILHQKIPKIIRPWI